MVDYQSTMKDAIYKKALLDVNRFAKITDRVDDSSELPVAAWEVLWKNSSWHTWKGMFLSQCVSEIVIYPMLVAELKPKTIIELGTFNGGSAVWLADQLEIFDIEGTVYTVDINQSLIEEKAWADTRIRFIKGDINHIDSVLPSELLSKLPHPWLVIEDCHANFTGVLNYFHNNGFQSGDYLIVDDTNPAQWEIESWRTWTIESELQFLPDKLNILRAWLEERQDQYLVDTYYTDLFGRNGLKSSNAILKRV